MRYKQRQARVQEQMPARRDKSSIEESDGLMPAWDMKVIPGTWKSCCSSSGSKDFNRFAPLGSNGMRSITTNEDITGNTVILFRRLAARCGYLSADLRDCHFSAKEVCWFMSRPTEVSVERLEQLACYLGDPKIPVYLNRWQEHIEAFDVYADIDCAGWLRTRKCSSRGCVMLRSHLLKSWAPIQPSITLSAGEADLDGLVKGSAAGLGKLPLWADLEVCIRPRFWTDCVALLGICKRQCLGRLRHLDLQDMDSTKGEVRRLRVVQDATRCGSSPVLH